MTDSNRPPIDLAAILRESVWHEAQDTEFDTGFNMAKSMAIALVRFYMGDAAIRKDAGNAGTPVPTSASIDSASSSEIPYNGQYLKKMLDMAKGNKLELDPYFAYRLVEAFYAVSTSKPVSVEDVCEKMWRRDYPTGGSIYRNYEETEPKDKEWYRREVKAYLDAAEVPYVD